MLSQVISYPCTLLMLFVLVCVSAAPAPGAGAAADTMSLRLLPMSIVVMPLGSAAVMSLLTF
eukprot:Pgem_evm1s10944